MYSLYLIDLVKAIILHTIQILYIIPYEISIIFKKTFLVLHTSRAFAVVRKQACTVYCFEIMHSTLKTNS